MGYTKFGEFMRIKRVKNHEVMADTAKLLGVKLPFISTVERGKRNVPEEWIPILIEHYNLDIKEQAELLDAVEHSKTQMKINLISANNMQRRLAVQFQRSFEKLDEDTATAIMNLLNKEDN
ncbi:MAG: helix-turn-helix domain-containing protein [Clostridiales bacterium]|nr:helix-turn-helix domain-containing protein [Clostridiales bacterium]